MLGKVISPEYFGLKFELAQQRLLASNIGKLKRKQQQLSIEGLRAHSMAISTLLLAPYVILFPSYTLINVYRGQNAF